MARLLGRMQRDRVLAPSFVRRALGPALALDAPAVLARARRVYADALRTSGEDARSTALLEQAFADSEAVGAVNEAFETAIRLAWVRARAGHPSAAAWIARARRLAPQCEDPTRAGRRVTLQHGILLGEQGDFDAALEVLQPLLDELPPGDALREEGITALGLTTLNASQNTDRAEALLREAYRLQVEQTSGPSLRVASGLHNLAIVEIERHDFHAALSLLEESLSEGREAGGTLHSLARTEEARASAVAYVEGWEAGARAFARVESAIASNPSMRLALVNLASSRCRAAQQLAPEAEAIQHCRVAWMRSRDYAPPGSMHGLMAANSYALVLLRLQSFGAAEAVLREALAASETEGLREHAVRAGLLNNLGRTHVGLDRGAEALDAFTKAKRIVDTVGGDNPMRAIVTFNLGRELARQGRVAAARQELLRARAHIDTMAAPPDLRVAIERALADVDAREARAG
jgi:tetratricopeptide (TPR) repeat protein